jgi:hypothetical protein
MCGLVLFAVIELPLMTGRINTQRKIALSEGWFPLL